MYAASDSTIVHLLKTLQLIHLDIPPYSSAVLMELSEDHSGKHIISVSSSTSTERQPSTV